MFYLLINAILGMSLFCCYGAGSLDGRSKERPSGFRQGVWGLGCAYGFVVFDACDLVVHGRGDTGITVQLLAWRSMLAVVSSCCGTNRVEDSGNLERLSLGPGSLGA